MTGIRKVFEALGWRVKYVPHELIKDYNACYRVVYRGRVINPPAADVLGIPLNEVWISERLRMYEDMVLFHELSEVMYRYLGLSVREAHLKARTAEALRFCSDSRWLNYLREYPDSTVPSKCLASLCDAVRDGVRSVNMLHDLLIKCLGR